MIAFEDWKEDFVNKDKDYAEYVHEVAFLNQSAESLRREIIRMFEKTYVSCKGVGWKKELLKEWIGELKKG